MIGNLYYKKYIEKLIKSNPATVIITRTEQIDDGYGGYTAKEINITETVTFYQKRSNRQTVNDSGLVIGYMASSIEKILALGDADIKKGDMFKANGRKYKVLFVNEYFDICKQIEVEVIQDGI